MYHKALKNKSISSVKPLKSVDENKDQSNILKKQVSAVESKKIPAPKTPPSASPLSRPLNPQLQLTDDQILGAFKLLDKDANGFVEKEEFLRGENRAPSASLT
jgi:hypothetical protein